MTSIQLPPPVPGSAAPPLASPKLVVPASPAPPPPPTPPAGPPPSLPPRWTGSGTSGSEQPPRAPRRIAPLVLVIAGLAVAMVLIAAAALPILQGGDDSPSEASPTVSPPTSLALRPAPASVGENPDESVTAEPNGAPAEAPAEAGTAAAPDEAVATTIAVVPAEPEPEPAADVAEVAESKAVVRGGQIFLEGAVPTAESGELIAALAAEILGPDNVFNNYVVDPRASDPNLGNVTVEDTINFPTGSSQILPESEALLNQALALMTIRPSVTVIVVGHTDSRGSDEYNIELSLQRAEAVKTWLTDRGIDGARLTVVGKGESEPIADNSTGEGQRLNRRIQFFLENLLADS